jgi:hypothetical protein
MKIYTKIKKKIKKLKKKLKKLYIKKDKTKCKPYRGPHHHFSGTF